MPAKSLLLLLSVQLTSDPTSDYTSKPALWLTLILIIIYITTASFAYRLYAFTFAEDPRHLGQFGVVWKIFDSFVSRTGELLWDFLFGVLIMIRDMVVCGWHLIVDNEQDLPAQLVGLPPPYSV